MLRNPGITSVSILGSDVCSQMRKLAPSCDSLPLEAFVVLCLLAPVCDEVSMIRWAHSLHSNHFHRGHLLGIGAKRSSIQQTQCTDLLHCCYQGGWRLPAPQLQQEGLATNIPGGKSEPLFPPPQHTTHTKHAVHTQHPTLCTP